MSRHLLALLAWLTTGHAVLSGLFWLLLQVPESNVAMLSTSALVVLAIVALVGLVEGGGLTLAAAESSRRDLARTLARAPLAAPLAVALFGLVWLLTGWAEAGWWASRGEIDAWLMARVGLSRTTALHQGASWVFAFLRYALGISLALTLLAQGIASGLGGLLRGRWLVTALSPLRLGAIAALLLGLVWLPWQAAYWRPGWIRPNWQEPAFVAVKLGLLYLVANTGWAGILAIVARGGRAVPPAASPTT